MIPIFTSPSQKEMLDALELYGIFIYKNVINQDQINDIKSDFLSSMELITDYRFQANDKSTWSSTNLPFNKNGSFNYFGLSSQRFNVDARMATQFIYKELLNTPQLYTSFNGVNFEPIPCNFEYNTVEEWNKTCKKTTLHIHHSGKDQLSIQSRLAIVDQPIDGFTMTCIPGSHKFYRDSLLIRQNENAIIAGQLRKVFNELIDSGSDIRSNNLRLLLRQIKLSEIQADSYWNNDPYFEVSFKMREELKNLSDPIRIPLEAGDAVFWDNRLMIGEASPCASMNPDLYRLDIPISMGFFTLNTKDILQRTKIWESSRSSNHQVEELHFRGPLPPKKDYKPMFFPRILYPCELSLEEQQLHGVITDNDDNYND